MKGLSLLVILCAATSAGSAQADEQSQLAAIRAACAGDAQKFCAGVQPGGGRIVACLKEHKDALSDQCKQAAGVPPNPGNNNAVPAPAAQPPPSAANAAVVSPVAPAIAPAGAAAATAASTGTAGGTPAKPVAAHKTTSGKADKTAAAEKFAERIITDADHGGMRAATIRVPEKWHFEGKVEWHYGWIEYPLSIAFHAENPDNAEAYFAYPLVRFDYVEIPPNLRQYDRGRKVGPGERMSTGAFSGPPRPAAQALALFIQKARPKVANHPEGEAQGRESQMAGAARSAGPAQSAEAGALAQSTRTGHQGGL